MILKDIEEELNRNCKRCICYRLKQMLESSIHPSDLNIDDFFEEEDKSQINLFEDVGNP